MKQLYCILFGVVILLAGCEKENSINSIMAPLRTITGIKMNWGYWYQWYIDGVNNTDYLNDGWYTLTGDWIVDKCISQSNYQYYRKMLHNFTVL